MTNTRQTAVSARVSASPASEGSGVSLHLSGRLDADGASRVWRQAHEDMARQDGPVRVDASELTYLDGSGAGLLLSLRLEAQHAGRNFELQGLPEELAPLLELYDPEDFAAPATAVKRPTFLEKVGSRTLTITLGLRQLVAFVGELTTALVASMRRPGLVRWKDAIRVAEDAGVNALPIICLIGFLMGLVMAFQSAVQLKRFGAEIFVADLLGISMARELGPLTTAILLAGRSGSSFSAEIGTMKVNEEVSALATMGLSPVQFLAVPRVLAAMVVTPVLSLVFTIVSLAGGSLVVLSFGYPLVTYVNKIVGSLTLLDITGGLFKALVFSVIVAAIGCQRGLSTGNGASAVGRSATSAVVTGLVLIAVTDGIFAVVFFILGI